MTDSSRDVLVQSPTNSEDGSEQPVLQEEVKITFNRDCKKLDFKNRDPRMINKKSRMLFEEIIAESDSHHSLRGIWGGSFVLYTEVKLMVYRILTTVLAIPLSLIYGVLFGIATFILVWIARPLLQLIEMFINFFGDALKKLLENFIKPLTQIIGTMCGRSPQ